MVVGAVAALAVAAATNLLTRISSMKDPVLLTKNGVFLFTAPMLILPRAHLPTVSQEPEAPDPEQLSTEERPPEENRFLLSNVERRSIWRTQPSGRQNSEGSEHEVRRLQTRRNAVRSGHSDPEP